MNIDREKKSLKNQQSTIDIAKNSAIIKNVKSKRYLLKVNMCYQKGVNT